MVFPENSVSFFLKDTEVEFEIDTKQSTIVNFPAGVDVCLVISGAFVFFLNLG